MVAVLYCFMNGEVRPEQTSCGSRKCGSFYVAYILGAAGAEEAVEEMEAHSAPSQSAPAAPRLAQQQRFPSHPGVPVAVLSGQPDDQRTPRGHSGAVIQLAFASKRVNYNLREFYSDEISIYCEILFE